MNNMNFYAVNSENEEMVNALSQAEGSAYEIDPALFERANEIFVPKGLALTILAGNLSTDPKPMFNPQKSKGNSKPYNKTVADYVSDDTYVYQADLCYETDVYFDKTGKRHSTNNYINLFFNTKGAKSMIVHYRKGDPLMVSGSLHSTVQVNPNDNTRKVNHQYLRVEAFMSSPGTHLRKEIRQQMDPKRNVTKKYNSLDEIFSDNSLTPEQQNDLAREFISRPKSADTNVPKTSEPATHEFNKAQSSKVEYHSDTVQSQNTVDNYEQDRISSLQDENEDYFGPDKDDFSGIFDGDF